MMKVMATRGACAPLFVLTPLLLLTACATTEGDYEVDEVDTEMERTQVFEDSQIGVKDGVAIIQSQNTASVELQIQRHTNMMLHDELLTESTELERCRAEVADPRLGGGGEVSETVYYDGMRELAKTQEKLGIAEDGTLRVVKKTNYVDELKSQRGYEQALRKMTRLVIVDRKKCESRMRLARVRAGLPAERFKARGYFTENGDWVETARGEQTLDDAFELQAKAREKRAKRERRAEASAEFGGEI